MRNLSLLVILFFVVFASCTKSAKKTTCSTSVLNGYEYGPPTAFNFGIINQSTAGIASLATLSVWHYGLYDDRAAYNTSDGNYYVFNQNAPDTLLRINASGAITMLTKASADTFFYSSIVYDQFFNKLYCRKDGILAELTITGSTYSANIIPADTVKGSTLTVDNTTGDIYFVTGDTVTHHIRKYTPGSSVTTTVATVSGGWDVIGLRFNKNNNKLYAMRENFGATTGLDFLQIDPATGITTLLATYSFDMNNEFYSAEIDPCSDQYILSSGSSAGPYIKQISMTGTVVQSNATSGIFLGLTIH